MLASSPAARGWAPAAPPARRGGLAVAAPAAPGGGARLARPARLRVRAQAAAAPSAGADAATNEWSSLAQVCAVLGSQWGDEGKGKLVDILAQRYDIVARCQGGANAGHTIYDAAGKKYALHLVPSGILNPGAQCVIGNGVVVHVPGLFAEIDALEAAGVKTAGRILVSDRAHLLFDLHKEVDGAREAELAGNMIGTTKRGIGPAYASKATRNGLRVCDLLRPAAFATSLRSLAADAKARFPNIQYDVEAEIARYAQLAERLRPMITDTVHYVHSAHAAGKRILVEGANATLLDLDFGTYPFVTSSNPSMGGVISGLGLAPRHFGCIVGVAKAYTTRVGSGPYPTELHGELGDAVRAAGHEYGTTTGRPRRCGWLDGVALRYACAINGFDSLNVTKLDVLSGIPELKIGTGYTLDGKPLPAFPADVDTLGRVQVTYETLPGWSEDLSACREWGQLPPAARAYIVRMEAIVGVECRYIGVGPGRDAIVIKPTGAKA